MRVQNGAIDSPAADLYTRPATKNAQGMLAESILQNGGSDRTSLPNTSQLVALAKTLSPSDRLSRFGLLQAAVSAGEYEADPTAVSQAVVDEHLNS